VYMCKQCNQFVKRLCCVSGVVSAKSEAAEKKQKVADLLSRNFNAFQKLSVYVEPVLGM